MPIVNIQVTKEGVTDAQKTELIKRTTQMLEEVLNKDPATTFVLIQEIALSDWGVSGVPVTEYRQRQNKD